MFLGYVLMIGGGSSDPAVFNPAMFDFRRLTLSPIVIIAGVAVVIAGIMYPGLSRSGKNGGSDAKD